MVKEHQHQPAAAAATATSSLPPVPATSSSSSVADGATAAAAAANENEKQMVGGCCVCADDMGYGDNLLVYCDGEDCEVAVHQGCYGISNVPEGNWYCRRCEFKLSSPAAAAKAEHSKLVRVSLSLRPRVVSLPFIAAFLSVSSAASCARKSSAPSSEPTAANGRTSSAPSTYRRLRSATFEPWSPSSPRTFCPSDTTK